MAWGFMSGGISSVGQSISASLPKLKPSVGEATDRVALSERFDGPVSRNSRKKSSPQTSLRRSSQFNVLNAQMRSSWIAILEIVAIVLLSIVTGLLYPMVIGKHPRFDDLLANGILVGLLFSTVIRIRSARQPFLMSRMSERLKDTLAAWSLSFVLLLFVLFVLKVDRTTSRGALLLLFASGTFVIPALQMFVMPLFVRTLSKLGSRETIIISADSDKNANRLQRELRSTGSVTPSVFSCRADCSDREWVKERQRLVTSVTNAAHRAREGEIIFLTENMPLDRVDSVVRSLSLLPRAIYVLPGAAISKMLRSPITSIGSNVAVEIQKEPLRRTERIIKRVLDLTVSAALLVFLAPVLLACAIAVKLDSAGPVFFRQTRNGFRGEKFAILKFRSMTVMEDGATIQQAQRNDARVTRVGRFLRKSSLDELPQLLNVLKGDMSLVGPRPHALAHDELYAKLIENYSIRQHVKPGITGLAQVSGFRGETGTVDLMYRRIEHDLWYATHCSLMLDLKILLQTFFEVLRQRNAY